jgi:hypothetical protein
MTRYKLRGTESDRTGDVHLWITRDDQPLDLEEIVEDLMWQQREIERLRGELDECRRLLLQVADEWDRLNRNKPGNRPIAPIVLLREWREAARATGGES